MPRGLCNHDQGGNCVHRQHTRTPLLPTPSSPPPTNMMQAECMVKASGEIVRIKNPDVEVENSFVYLGDYYERTLERCKKFIDHECMIFAHCRRCSENFVTICQFLEHAMNSCPDKKYPKKKNIKREPSQIDPKILAKLGPREAVKYALEKASVEEFDVLFNDGEVHYLCKTCHMTFEWIGSFCHHKARLCTATPNVLEGEKCKDDDHLHNKENAKRDSRGKKKNSKGKKGGKRPKSVIPDDPFNSRKDEHSADELVDDNEDATKRVQYPPIDTPHQALQKKLEELYGKRRTNDISAVVKGDDEEDSEEMDEPRTADELARRHDRIFENARNQAIAKQMLINTLKLRHSMRSIDSEGTKSGANPLRKMGEDIFNSAKNEHAQLMEMLQGSREMLQGGVKKVDVPAIKKGIEAANNLSSPDSMAKVVEALVALAQNANAQEAVDSSLKSSNNKKKNKNKKKKAQEQEVASADSLPEQDESPQQPSATALELDNKLNVVADMIKHEEDDLSELREILSSLDEDQTAQEIDTSESVVSGPSLPDPADHPILNGVPLIPPGPFAIDYDASLALHLASEREYNYVRNYIECIKERITASNDDYSLRCMNNVHRIIKEQGESAEIALDVMKASPRLLRHLNFFVQAHQMLIKSRGVVYNTRGERLDTLLANRYRTYEPKAV